MALFKVVVLGSVVVGTLLLAGCGAHAGEARVTYTRRGLPPPLSTVTIAGEYGLYAADDEASPLAVRSLKPGDLYGFRKLDDDSMVAVARTEEIPLLPRYVPSYYWKLRK